MFQALLKNTFLALQNSEETASREAALGTSVRARSADSAVDNQKLREERCDDSLRAQLRCLDALVLSGPPGLKASAQRPQDAEALKEGRQPKVSVEYKPRLGLAKHSALKNCFRVASNSSVSTMAPDDASDCEDDVGLLTRNFHGVNGMRHAVSSGSVCSLISELDEETFSDEANRLSTQMCEDLLADSLSMADVKVTSTATMTEPPRSPSKSYGSRSATEDFSHCHVPRHVNLAEEFEKSCSHSAPTTIMIRNIPNRYTQAHIMKELDTLGFGGTYDFFYAPIDKCTRCNVGYAFVNFLRPEVAAHCMQIMENHYFRSNGRQREKLARVSVAHIQGFEANIRHYKDAAVNSAQHDGRGPVIMPSIARSLGSLLS